MEGKNDESNFLDFNSVLDTYENMDIVDSFNLNILIEIINETDAKVVIFSSIKNSYFYNGNAIINYLINVLKEKNIKLINFLNIKRKEVIKDNKDNEVIIYEDKDGITRVNVKFIDEDIWLTKYHIADIYKTTRQNIE